MTSLWKKKTMFNKLTFHNANMIGYPLFIFALWSVNSVSNKMEVLIRNI
mgnify:CR=1 FL=1